MHPNSSMVDNFVLLQPDYIHKIIVNEETPQEDTIPMTVLWNRAYVRNDTDYYLYLYREGQSRLISSIENGVHKLLILPQPAPFENFVIRRSPLYLPNSPNLIEIAFGTSPGSNYADQRISKVAKRINEEYPEPTEPIKIEDLEDLKFEDI